MWKSILCTAAASAVMARSDVDAAFYEARSPELVLEPKVSADGSSIMFVDHSEGLSLGPAVDAIDAVDVADHLTAALGLAPLQSASASSSLLQTSFFTRPRVNVVVSLDGVGAAVAREHSDVLVHLTALGQDVAVAQMALRMPGVSADAVSALTTIATGMSPAEHGVVAGSWQDDHGARVDAYSSDSSSAATASVVDLLAQTFEGQSLTMSLAGTSQPAAAFCLHPSVKRGHADWHSHCEGRVLTPPELESAFSTGGPGSVLVALTQAGLKANFDGEGVVSVHFMVAGEARSAAFDLAVEVDRTFLADMQGVYAQVYDLTTNAELLALTMDNYPDFFAVSMPGFKGMGDTYGQDSPKALAALKLIDGLVPLVLSTFDRLYPDRLLAQVVMLASWSPVPSADLLSALTKATGLSPTEVLADFPAIYSRHRADTNALCSSVHQAVANTEYTVHCPGLQAASRRALLQTPASAAVVTAAMIADYQMMVWVSIVLAFSLLSVVYSLAFMSFKKDTLLYSTFNPKWEDRKTK